MKTKMIFAALAFMAGAVITAQAVTKKTAPVKKAAKVTLVTGNDSVSYAAGQALTDGLMPYLKQQFHVDSAYIPDFIQGMKEARGQANNPRFAAHQAGAQIVQMIEQRMLPGISKELNGTRDSVVNANKFYQGFFDAVQNDSTIMSMKKAQAFFKARMEEDKKLKGEKLAAPGKAWLAANAKKDSVITLPSGLQYKVLTMGTGVKPKANQEVTVKYEGKLTDGTVFDSSYKRNPPTTKFKCNQVIKGWTEALQLMPVGSKWVIYVPQELGYGEHPSGKIPPYSTLIFTVELEDVTPEPAAPAVKTPEEKAAEEMKAAEEAVTKAQEDVVAKKAALKKLQAEQKAAKKKPAKEAEQKAEAKDEKKVEQKAEEKKAEEKKA